ncbi:CPBP family intramembrane glutamic endopeptidase [Microlunatus sp. GCM10028923]|uniref:CPBP family intramembrane glutamic endopeptidase n=1 Tax=Microlunatus sp. GCM10028923 TaxID=3273400 RepID=UPI0036152206
MTERPGPAARPLFLRRPALAQLAVLVVLAGGVGLLHLSFASPPGSTRFYGLSLALAAVWLIGGLLVPVDLWPVPRRSRARTFVAPVMAGLLLAVIFVIGAILVDRLPVLGDGLSGVFGYAARGLLPLVLLITVINAVAEELFFRGALWRLTRPGHRYAVTTLLYVLATIATGHPLLVFAAAVLGLVTGRLRQVTGGVLAPILAHSTWSVIMLLAVPPLTT